MEPLSLLSPNTDNLFKFLFLNGVVMIAIGLFYPLQKTNELQLKILEYNKKVELLGQDAIKLKNDVKVLNVIVDSRIKLAESLVSKRKYLKSESEIVSLNNEINEIKLKTNLEYQEKLKNENDLINNKITLAGEKLVINELKDQACVYDSYCFWLFTIGILSGIIGFFGWVVTTFFSEFPNYTNFNECWRNEMRKKRRKKSIRKSNTSETAPNEIGSP